MSMRVCGNPALHTNPAAALHALMIILFQSLDMIMILCLMQYYACDIIIYGSLWFELRHPVS